MSFRIKTFDIILPLIPLLIICVGISVIYSLVYSTPDSGLAVKQGINALIGFSALVVISFVDYRFFKSSSWIFWLIAVLLLVYVDFFGSTAKGATRWINLGFFQLQPSEVAKAFLIFSFSSFFCEKIGKITWKDIGKAAAILVLPLTLVLMEPDLGTALVLGFIFLVILLTSRPGKAKVAVIVGMMILASTIMLLAAFNRAPFSGLLHDYQRNRILTFLDPNLDPYGKGYNVRQAEIAIGSGGLIGKGLGKGSQSQLKFLPEPHTDFIFSGISESFGFLGTGIFITLFAILIIRVIAVADMARDNFGMLVCMGVAAMLFFQVMVNVGMNLGLAPVTGIPLPFASSGGSALIAYLFLIGIVESIFIRHKKISF